MHIHVTDVTCPICEFDKGFSIVLDPPREATNSALLAVQYIAKGSLLTEAMRSPTSEDSLLSELMNERLGRGTRVICKECDFDKTVEELPVSIEELAEAM